MNIAERIDNNIWKKFNINWNHWETDTESWIILPTYRIKERQIKANIWNILENTEELINKVPELEDSNLKIPTDNTWKKTYIYWMKAKVNPAWNVWEFLENAPNWEKIKWEQIFTYQAAIHEAKLQGKKLPTIEQWKQIIKSLNPDINLSKSMWTFQDDFMSIEKILWLKLSGFYIEGATETDGSHGEKAIFWSSTNTTFAECDLEIYDCYSVGFGGNTISWDELSSNVALSVRCIKNKTNL